MHRQAELAGQQQRARPEERDVLADAPVLDRGLAAGRGEAALGGFVPDRLQPGLAELGDRPDDRDLADVERSDELGDRAAECPAGRPDHAQRLIVAGGGLRGQVVQALRAGPADDGGRARDGLETAVPTAVTGIAVGVDDDVTDLAGRLAVAAEQLIAKDQPGTDATTDLDHDEVRRSDVALEEVGREGGGAAVVGDDGRQAVALLEEAREREVLPVEADGPADRAVLVDDARRADTDAEDRGGRRRPDLVDQLVDDVDRLVAVAPIEVTRGSRRQFAAEVGKRRGEGPLAEVEGDDRPAVGV